MRRLVLALCCFALLPSVAWADNSTFYYNSYMRDIKKAADEGWTEIQAADASTTKEERCGHASRAVYLYDQAARTSQTMVEVLAQGNNGELYNDAVETRDAARDVAQQVQDLYNQKCG